VQLQQSSGAIRALGGRVVAVSTDPVAVSRALAQRLHLAFPILSDGAGRLGSAFGVFGTMGPVDGHSVFILGRRGHVRWKRTAFQTMHVPVSAILAALRAVSGR
jgi:peroxiredoxin